MFLFRLWMGTLYVVAVSNYSRVSSLDFIDIWVCS